jgi:hypothetical protein
MTDVQTPTPLSLPRIVAGATAYAPLPVDPFWERARAAFAGPKPSPSPAPGGPAYPSLPVEPDTRAGGGGGKKK